MAKFRLVGTNVNTGNHFETTFDTDSRRTALDLGMAYLEQIGKDPAIWDLEVMIMPIDYAVIDQATYDTYKPELWKP